MLDFWRVPIFPGRHFFLWLTLGRRLKVMWFGGTLCCSAFQGQRIPSLRLVGPYQAESTNTRARHYYCFHFIQLVPHSEARHCLHIATVMRVTHAEVTRVLPKSLRFAPFLFTFHGRLISVGKLAQQYDNGFIGEGGRKAVYGPVKLFWMFMLGINWYPVDLEC
jgi:hypothetical protein